jgi:hypothetical protein
MGIDKEFGDFEEHRAVGGGVEIGSGVGLKCYSEYTACVPSFGTHCRSQVHPSGNQISLSLK